MATCISLALALTFSCSSDNDESLPSTKSYTVITDNGELCNVMIRTPAPGYVNSNYSDYTIKCPSGTKIACMRVYDRSMFVLASGYASVDANGNGDGNILMLDKFSLIDSISLHENSCTYGK
ncbi:MAG: hypothetical protein LBC85_08825 [Fibromonadaceae bacterium]|nr:hypothetical protein [Fibromonadaceae bacterium]